jgi:hypothetical protein
MAERKAKKKSPKRAKPSKGERASVRRGEITALNVIALGLSQRVERIEQFLGDDLRSWFHEKQTTAPVTNGPQAGPLTDPE